MRNLWIQTENAFATWIADLTALRDRPDDLVALAEVILDAGARHAVFTPVEVPNLDLRRGQGPAVAERVRARWRDQRAVDLFAFTDAAMQPGAPGSSTVEATMAWYAADDRLVEGAVADLGAVLRALEPVPGSIPDGFTTPYPPVRITGPELIYDEARTTLVEPSVRRAANVRIAIHADIWFPFVFGSAHPDADHRRMFDNRELAQRHTPRLNAFLIEVGDQVVKAGGAWRVDEDETGTNAALWLDERGILVDAPEPELMPAAALQTTWY